MYVYTACVMLTLESEMIKYEMKLVLITEIFIQMEYQVVNMNAENN